MAVVLRVVARTDSRRADAGRGGDRLGLPDGAEHLDGLRVTFGPDRTAADRAPERAGAAGDGEHGARVGGQDHAGGRSGASGDVDRVPADPLAFVTGTKRTTTYPAGTSLQTPGGATTYP